MAFKVFATFASAMQIRKKAHNENEEWIEDKKSIKSQISFAQIHP